MKSESNRSVNESDQALTPFEQKLRCQSFGPVANGGRKLMYECGYAAGNRNSRRTITRWRVVGLVASMLACVSHGSYLTVDHVNRTRQIGNSKADGENTRISTDASLESIGDWGARLRQRPHTDRQTVGTLRASASVHDFTNLDESDVVLNPVPSTIQNTPLRPIDYTLLLLGEFQ